MLDASHAIIGASVAKLITNPYWGFPVNLILHIFCDLTPHWDLNTRKVKRPKWQIISFSLTDAFLGYLIGFLLFRNAVPPWYLISMMFVAQLPDWLESPYHIFDWNFPPFSSIKKFQSTFHHKLDLPWGLITQITTILAFIALARLT